MKSKLEVAAMIARVENGLTPEQAHHLDSARWFLFSGRGSGRSHVYAVAVISEAIRRPGEYVPIIDHDGGNHGDRWICEIIYAIIRRVFPADGEARRFSIRRGAVRSLCYEDA